MSQSEYGYLAAQRVEGGTLSLPDGSSQLFESKKWLDEAWHEALDEPQARLSIHPLSEVPYLQEHLQQLPGYNPFIAPRNVSLTLAGAATTTSWLRATSARA